LAHLGKAGATALARFSAEPILPAVCAHRPNKFLDLGRDRRPKKKARPKRPGFILEIANSN
jgi:hypothetical protein